jgi:XTP/dITP diphosphohydrolase
MNMKLFVSTQNPDKLRELAELIGPDVELHHPAPGDPPVVENGDTLWENALLKARAGYERTGLPAIGDDTGLEVDGLGGEPGVYSSRYAGEDATYEDNLRKLLEELQGATGSARKARFRTALAYVDGERAERFDGVLEGHILAERRGGGGFGYDPVFLPEGAERTLAEMDPEEKNRISHRGRALRAFVQWWKGES